MKWFQLDTDFFTRPAIRSMFCKYQQNGITVVLYVWSRVAGRLEAGDVSCRLYDGVDLVALDTGVPVDKVDGILNHGCSLNYENIHGIDYPIFDRDPITRQLGSHLIFYKADKNTRNSQTWQRIRDERDAFDRRTGGPGQQLASHLQATGPTYPPTNQQTNLPGLSGPSVAEVDPGQFHPLLIEHIKNSHKDGKPDPGCWACRAHLQQPKAATA